MKIQALLFPGLTTIDLVGPLQPLAYTPNAEIELVAARPGPVPSDAGIPILATTTFDDADRNPDIFVVPGGGKPAIDQLEDPQILAFVAEQGARADWIVSVCTGALLLGAAGLLRGYRAATHWSVMEELEAFGAIPTYQRVVIDRNRCTGGGLTAGVDVGIAVAGAVFGDAVGQELELLLEYNPEPPYRTGHPSLAPKSLIERVRPMAGAAMQPDRVRRIAATIRESANATHGEDEA